MTLMTQSAETLSDRLLEQYVQTVGALVEGGGDIDSIVAGVEAAHDSLFVPEFRMPDRYRIVRDHVPYTRNCIYQDPDHKFAVVSICWGPFQETPVHDHLNWCVVGVLEGLVHAIDYDRLDDESDPRHVSLEISKTALHHPGEVVGLTPPARSNVHKMANGSAQRAVSLHTYGDPGMKARVFDAAAGTVEIRDLEFHNLMP